MSYLDTQEFLPRTSHCTSVPIFNSNYTRYLIHTKCYDIVVDFIHPQHIKKSFQPWKLVLLLVQGICGRGKKTLNKASLAAKLPIALSNLLQSAKLRDSRIGVSDP